MFRQLGEPFQRHIGKTARLRSPYCGIPIPVRNPSPAPDRFCRVVGLTDVARELTQVWPAVNDWQM